ncbi:hypothetical protein [Ktedonobacter racemifer]|uniref:Uncharacterized protein n=1 Tax=Ktedonobacter racemifer DSM 44963 TaxID=485913 RepID=D6TW18_KTERA|nr:hypothetical protein [Ktedonobacter racemifer]EFH84401.1 conserved hypothetical protein [Ktedonobacter racemifer DSM 44963]
MALFTDALVQEIAALVCQRYRELGMALGEPELPAGQRWLDERSSLWQELDLLIRIANGEYARIRATRDDIQRAEAALYHLRDLLLGNTLRSKASFPADFWRTDIGVLVSRVRWWVSVDDLITISNAAALAFGENTQANRMRIGRAIESGLLEWIPDPSVANPQQNKRVFRSQVERLGAQRRLLEE